MFDAHCHLDDPRFDDQWPQLIKNARKANLSHIVSAGIHPSKIPQQQKLAQIDFPISLNYGLHPWEAAKLNKKEIDQTLTLLREALQASSKYTPPVAIGEIGLDLSPKLPPESHDLQRYAFREQLAIAKEYDLPIVIHAIRSHHLILKILKSDQLPPKLGMIHGFSGHPDLAKSYLKMGLYLSFGSNITYPKSRKTRLALKEIPLDRLLVETDAPDSPPAPLHGQLNEPANLPLIIEKIAQIREEPFEKITAQTTSNSQKLFFSF